MRDVVEVAVFGHICRRVRPIPRVVRAVIGVEHIVARVLQIFRRAFALLHIAPDFLVFLARNCALAQSLRLAENGIAQRNGVILTARRLDGFHRFDGEAVAVLERAAVFVGALIGIGEGELIEQIPLVYGMYLHAVHARLFAQLCRLRKGAHHLSDLLFRDGAALHVLCPARGQGRGRRADIGYVDDGSHERAERLVL